MFVVSDLKGVAEKSLVAVERTCFKFSSLNRLLLEDDVRIWREVLPDEPPATLLAV